MIELKRKGRQGFRKGTQRNFSLRALRETLRPLRLNFIRRSYSADQLTE
jgi:hypothetical protein